MPLILFCMSLFLSFSCSRNDREEFEISLQHIRDLLTERRCDDALEFIDTLDKFKDRSTNPEFLSLQASAFACKGNYDDFRFFEESLSLMDGLTDSNMLYSLAAFYNAQDAPDSSFYQNLARAINTLLYPGKTERVSHLSRRELFGERIAHNVNSQILYMLLAQLGRYGRYYGNMGLSGDDFVKGAGSGSNSCFTDYTTAPSQAARSTLIPGSNPCSSDSDGHPDMQAGAPNRIAIMCEGIVMMNNLFEIIVYTLVKIQNSGELGGLLNINRQLCETHLTNRAICNAQTQSECEGLPVEEIEVFSLLYFEATTDTP